jgi:hypothetical protein
VCGNAQREAGGWVFCQWADTGGDLDGMNPCVSAGGEGNVLIEGDSMDLSGRAVNAEARICMSSGVATSTINSPSSLAVT